MSQSDSFRPLAVNKIVQRRCCILTASSLAASMSKCGDAVKGLSLSTDVTEMVDWDAGRTTLKTLSARKATGNHFTKPNVKTKTKETTKPTTRRPVSGFS